MLRTCVVLTMALLAAGAGANSTRGVELWSLLQVWRPALQLQWSDSPALSAQCAASMQRFSRAINERQQWASKMLDATGQYSSQFLTGSDFWLGSYADCQRALDVSKVDVTMRAVFRVATLSVNLSEPLVAPQLKDHIGEEWQPRRIYQGLCLPAECGAKEEVRSLLELMIEHAEPSEVRGLRDVHVHAVKVLPGEYSVWTDPWFGVLGTTSLLLLALTILGSSVDIFNLWQPDTKPKNTGEQPGKWREMAVSFSVGRNSLRLFSMHSKDGSLSSIHGMRVLGMTWIILCHAGRYGQIFGENPSARNSMEKDFLYQAVSNGTFSVDTFLFISGVLFTYIFLQQDTKKVQRDSFRQGVHKFFKIFSYRYVRLLPPYIFMYILSLVAMRYLSDNSVFTPSTSEHVYCTKNWWMNVLYIQNLFPISQTCMSYTWYLAMDMQLYLVTAILLLLFTNGRVRTAVISGCVLLLGSWVTTMVISISLEYIPTTEDPNQYYVWFFTKPWLRLGPYFVGIAAGWFMYKTECKVVMSKTTVAAGWLTCTVGMVGIVHALYFRAFDVLTSAVYTSLSHTLWAACLAWIVIACSSGYGGWVTRVLSCEIFFPFGRATYFTYMIHHPLMEWVFLNMEGPLFMSRGLMLIVWIGFLLVSYSVGLLLTLLVELPFLGLLTILHPIKDKPVKKFNCEHKNDEVNQNLC